MKQQKIKEKSEREIQTEILEYLLKSGIFVWRNNVGRKHNLYFGLKGSNVGIVGDGGQFMRNGIQRTQDIETLTTAWCLNKNTRN